MTNSFAAFEEEFLRHTAEIVWCTATTVDRLGRPRSRILHPIFEVRDNVPVGWVITGRTPVKTRHLAMNPHVACSYWSPAQNVVLADCVASWVEDDITKQHVWDLFMGTPPPLGYDMGPFGSPQNPIFTPLRLDPWRIQILDGKDFPANYTPLMWRREEG